VTVDQLKIPHPNPKKGRVQNFGIYDEELTQKLRLKTTKRTSLAVTYEKARKIIAEKNIKTMTDQFTILGESMDPTIYYQTNAEYYRRITQISFIELFYKGYIYKGSCRLVYRRKHENGALYEGTGKRHFEAQTRIGTYPSF
jgi:hypothetical protein